MFSLLCFQSKLHLIFRSEDAWCASHTPERLSWKLHGMELKIIIRITLRKWHLQCHQAFPLSSKGNCKLDVSPAVCDKCTSCTHHPPLTSTCTHTCTHVGPRQASPFNGQGAVVAYQKSSHHFHTTRQYFLITWLGKVLRGMIWKKNYGKSAPWGPSPASFPPQDRAMEMGFCQASQAALSERREGAAWRRKFTWFCSRPPHTWCRPPAGRCRCQWWSAPSSGRAPLLLERDESTRHQSPWPLPGLTIEQLACYMTLSMVTRNKYGTIHYRCRHT